MSPIIIQQADKSTIVDIITIVVPAFVTIIGLLVNYFFTNRNIKNEISKKKVDISLKYLSEAPYKSLELFEKMKSMDVDKERDEYLKLFTELSNTVFAYGSEDAIKILGAFQQNNYAMNHGNGDKQKAVAFFILLTCQIKYDLTGIEISPDSWYRMKITDYETNIENKERFIKATNEVVDELNLKEFMKIK